MTKEIAQIEGINNVMALPTVQRLVKNEEERIIDSLRHMINVNYIKKSNGKDNRSKIHNAFIELLE